MLKPVDYPDNEIATIAGLIKADSYSASKVAKILTDADFFDPYNAMVYSIIRKRRDAGVSIAPTTLKTDISMAISEQKWCFPGDDKRDDKRDEKIEAKTDSIISALYLHRGATGRAADLEFHSERVADASRIRRTYSTLEQMIAMAETFAHSEATDSLGGKQLMSSVQSLAMGLSDGQMVSDGMQLDDIVTRRLDEIEADYQNPRRVLRGYDTGFPLFNLRTSGICPGRLYVIAAERGFGKTSFMLDIVRNTSRRNRLPWQIFSREMSSDEIGERMLFQEARVDATRYAERKMLAEDWVNLRSAKTRLVEVGRRIDVYDGSGMTVERVASICRQAKFAGRCGGIAVDYIQILDAENKKKFGNRTLELDSIAKSLKDIAMELKVPLITPSQLNKQGTARESGGIENAADLVMILKPKVEGDFSPLATITGVDYVGDITKNRSGSRSPVDLKFYPGMTRFDEPTTPNASRLEFVAKDGTQF